MNLIEVAIIGWVVLVVLIVSFLKGASDTGCGGSCNQGRTKCDCKSLNKNENSLEKVKQLG